MAALSVQSFGGYNLQAAFSTARLAMDAIAKRLR